MLVALIGIWGIAAALLIANREHALERAQVQLSMTVERLADFKGLAGKPGSAAFDAHAATRRAAIWRALLQYPTAFIWVESDGRISAGQQPKSGFGPFILAEEHRGDFTVHAALPIADALRSWRHAARSQIGLLLAFSATFLLLTRVLMNALRQRAAAERGTAIAEERATQLALRRAQLEVTVAQRTTELRDANAQLETELVERKVAEEVLRQHDALLNAVTKSAAELLGSHSVDEALSTVLELVGQTVAVGRVQLATITPDRDGHLRSTLRHEWCAPQMAPLIDHPALRDLDLSVELPKLTAPALTGGLAMLSTEELSGPYRKLFEQAEMRSLLQIPVHLEGKLWGGLNFVDSANGKREWSWAETDTLQTLAELIGVAITRARYVKELADANMIVQNSPTILYRLGGEPSFPLIYISHNITKFGHDPEKLVGSAKWLPTIVHPDDRSKLAAAMARILEKDAEGASIEFRLETREGAQRWVENRYTPVRDQDGRLREVEGIIIDITERKAAEEKIALLARTDALTGLANRATFIERLGQAFAASKRGASPFAVLYLDLDHFKNINDTLGHPVGDLLLREVALRLKGATREADLVARLGGDEFAILQTDMGEPANAGALAAKIQASLGRPFALGGNEMHIGASIGICPFSAASAGPDAMLAQADLALYRAKDEGRNQYRFHSDELDREVLTRITLADDLRHAIECDQLELYYQPQVELVSGKIVGMEALVRWHHPTRGLLHPPAFIPIAEKTGTILALGQWVLDRACRQLKTWRDEGVGPPIMSINLSLAQIRAGSDLVSDVAKSVAKWGLSPNDLEFDVTEAALAQATWSQSGVLAELRRLGAKIALDDFGTEYSSFDYLRAYRVNHLKIAQSFISEAVHDPDRAATIRAIISLAREFGIEVIAEGVETEEQRALLVSTGSTGQAQGYYFSEAVVAARADELLRQGSIRPHAATVKEVADNG